MISVVRLSLVAYRAPGAAGAGDERAGMAGENFQVDLHGIVDLLSNHLYSSPRVYLRELLQNHQNQVIQPVNPSPWGDPYSRL
jgi:hypothetical protein